MKGIERQRIPLFPLISREADKKGKEGKEPLKTAFFLASRGISLEGKMGKRRETGEDE